MHHQRLLKLNKNQEREEDGARKKIIALTGKFSPMIKIMQTTSFQIVMPVTLMMTWIET
jgi:hypothetical protein